MKLTRVSIANFRSIQEMEIDFDPMCRILVGINESGKTNILNAISLLDPKRGTTRRDVREARLNEPAIDEAYVRFVFSLDDLEIADIVANAKTKFLAKSFQVPIVRIGGTQYTLDDFCATREGLYIVNLLSGKRYAQIWALADAHIVGPWRKVAASCPGDFMVVTSEKESVPLKQFSIIDTSAFDGIPPEYLEDVVPETVNDLVGALVRSAVERNLLPVLLWDYDETKLLPSRINLEQFCANPGSCIPLMRMFQLYKTPDIKKAIDLARAGGTNGLANLLRRVAAKTSKHFHSTWREYDGIQFSLSMDGPELVAGIADVSNHYELSQRSDGFKRFVTFLLLVSAEAESNLLKNTVILIDEPEIGLHPTGARYLMDELIDISHHNYVVFSTHSIFMIDSKRIDRHLIVKKNREITSVEVVSASNIQDEEVIYKSLGYSIFSNLKPKNLIFEGWRDKRLFDVAISRVPAAREALKRLNALGHCFSQGVKQIRCITPLFEAGERKCLILSDSDVAARQHQREYTQLRGYGTWKRYDELLPGSTASTGEDFIGDRPFSRPLEKVRIEFGIPALPVATLNGPDGKISTLRRWLQTNGVSHAEAERALLQIKDTVFENLKASDLRPEYYDYLAGVLGAADAM